MPISGVGVKPDGTLGWVDSNGYEVNPDGTPMQDAQRLQPLQPAPNTAPQGGIPTPLGTIGATPPPAPAAPAAPAAAATNAARDALVAALAAQYGSQQGKSAPVTTTVRIPANAKLPDGSADPNAGKTLQQATDRDLYTFGNGTSAEITPDGQLSNLKLGPGAGTAKTGEQVMAAQGQILAPNGQVYVKNTDTSPGAPPYVLDTNSQNNQQLANARTVADTSVAAANARKQQIDNAIASATDPAQLAQLQNAKTQAEIDVQNATAAKSKADIAYQQGMLGVSQGNLGVAQGNLAVNQAKTGADINTQAINNQIALAKLQPELGLTGAQTQNYLASAQSAISKANEPQMLQTGTGPTYTYYDPKTQQMVTAQNQAYLPTDPGRMTAQLKQQADAQWQTLQQQVAAGSLTGDQAASQFDRYWNENIEPVKGDIASAQAKAQSAIAQQQAMTGYYNAQAANIPATLAQNASDAAQRVAVSMMPYMVNSSAASNPGFTLNAKGFPQINAGQIMQNATYSLPNLQEIGRQGAAAALANISPTAAMHAQTPGPLAQPPAQGLPDLSSMLNLNQYTGGQPGGNPLSGQAGYGPGYGLNLNNVVNTTGQPGGAQVGGPVMPPAAPPPPPPALPANPQWYQDWQASQGQSAADQAAQAQFQWPAYQPAQGNVPGLVGAWS